MLIGCYQTALGAVPQQAQHLCQPLSNRQSLFSNRTLLFHLFQRTIRPLFSLFLIPVPHSSTCSPTLALGAYPTYYSITVLNFVMRLSSSKLHGDNRKERGFWFIFSQLWKYGRFFPGFTRFWGYQVDTSHKFTPSSSPCARSPPFLYEQLLKGSTLINMGMHLPRTNVLCVSSL